MTIILYTYCRVRDADLSPHNNLTVGMCQVDELAVRDGRRNVRKIESTYDDYVVQPNKLTIKLKPEQWV